MSGERTHSVPSAVVPFVAGNADSATSAMSTYTTTTTPIALKRLRGRSRPGRRASSA